MKTEEIARRLSANEEKEMLIHRYFAAKAFEKTTGDMSEPMGESSSCLRV
jgi:hypothetical protein